MIVKVLMIQLYILESNSLKDKRRVLSSLIKRCQQKFNVSISELEDMDQHKHSTIGIVTITNSNTYADTVLDKCLDLIQLEYNVDIIDIKRERL